MFTNDSETEFVIRGEERVAEVIAWCSDRFGPAMSRETPDGQWQVIHSRIDTTRWQRHYEPTAMFILTDAQHAFEFRMSWS